MLEIVVSGREFYDEEKNEFVMTRSTRLLLEHSLISLSKWESKWEKPFLSSEKTIEETIDYIRCMTLTQNVDPSIYLALSDENVKSVVAYIESPMTATRIKNQKQARKNSEIVTAEIIYYWMVTLNIPFECQKWHLNKLLTLIEVCSIKNQPQKKMSKNEILRNNRELNAARRAKYKTKG